MKHTHSMWRSVLACILAFCLMFGATGPVLAETVSGTGEKTTLNYVSIGDSMANGYCFTGYEQGEKGKIDFFKGEGVYGDAAYPNLFATYLESKGYDVNHTKLALSALRAEDLNFLLGGREEPTDGWEDQPNGYAEVDDDDALAAFYQEAVTKADIITLGIGNASFGAYLLHRATDALGVLGGTLDEDERVTLEEALVGLDEEQKTIVTDIYNNLMVELVAAVPADLAAQYDLTTITDLLAYTVAGFLVNYQQCIERIMELNPNCEVILVGLMNTTYGMNITVDGADPIPVGDIMDEMFGMLNAYIAGVPTAMQASGLYPDATFYYAEDPNPLFISQQFANLMEIGWKELDGLSGETVRERNISAYNSSLRKVISTAFKSLFERIPDNEQTELPSITLNDVKAYENAVPSWTLAEYGYGFTGQDNDFKNLSIAIYLGIEAAVAASTDTMDIPLTGLIKIATDLESVFKGFMPDMASPATVQNALATRLTSTDEMKGMCKIYALFKVGNGMSVHPTPAGHRNLYNAIKNAYENKVTAQDQTIANLKKAAEVLADLVAEYYDEAYAYAYAEAKNAGYIDTAKAAIGAAIAELKALDLSEVPMTDAFKAEVAGEVEEIVEALTAAQNLLVEADVLDQAALDALIATLDEAGEAVENLKNLLAQAGVDVTELVVVPALEAAIEKIETEVIPAAEKAVKEIAAAAYDYLIEKLAEAYDYLTDAAVEAAKKYGPAAVEWVYNYLLNNSDAVIAFVNENGPAVAEFLGEYAEELLAVLGFLAYSYGDEAVDYVLNNYEDVLATMSYLVAAYGDEAWALIEVYAEALGITDAINEKLDNIEQIVNEQLAELNSKLEALEKELAAKKAQLENAAGALKEEINAAIAEIEAAIAEVKAVMAELKEILEAAEDVAGSVEELIGVITGKVEGSLTEAVAKVQAALDKLAAAADAAKSTVEAVNVAIDAIVEIVKALEIDEETLCAVIAKAKACLKELIDELLAAAKEAVVEYGPEAVEYIYNYLLNNPEEVIAFVSEYGPAAVELLKEHAEELLAVLGYLAYTYGEDLADYIVENREDVLATLCELVEEYGDEAWALIDVYAEALGITAAIQEKLDCIENSIQEQLAELNSKLEALEKELAEKKAQLENALNELKDELAELKAQLENASGELKEEIEAAIAEIESTIETLENAIAEIEAKIAEIQNAIEELKEELAAIVEESKALYAATSELVDAIEEMIAIASGELEGDLTEAIAKVQAALVKVGEAIEAAETLTNALGEIIDGAVTLTKELLEASDELQAAVDKAIADAENAVNELVEELESILAELPEELREEIQTVIDEIQTAVKETVAELATAAKELASEVLGDLAEDVEAALVPVVDYVTTEGQKLVDELLAVLKEMYIDATTDEYTVTDDSYYVALGDGTAVSESYVDRLAEALGVDYNNLAQEGLLMENIQQILMENAAEILKADLITVGYGNNAFTNYTVEQLMNQIDGVEATFDWSLYVGEDGVPYVKDALADVHAHFVESGMNGDYMGANVADLLTLAVESYAYSYMAYVCSYPEAINAIREMNPEALIIIVGMYNPLDNVVVDFDGTPFAIGEYVQYLIDVTNLHTTAYAMLTSNAIYVDAPDVETINTRTEMTAMQFIVEYMYRRGVNMNPSENGHEYIKDQILNALTITVEEKGLLGDADSNGVVNSVDAALILQYDALIVDENGLDLSVCDVNGDGVVNSVDSAYILQYDALLITEFPASK